MSALQDDELPEDAPLEIQNAVARCEEALWMMHQCQSSLPASLQRELSDSSFDASMSPADLALQERYMELLPPTLRRHLEASPRFREGWLSPEDFSLMSLGIPPRADRPQGVVDWLWYRESFRGFPVKWRRAFAEDPPIYDATMLLRVLVDSLRCGEACWSEELPTQRDFARLLKHGTPAWQRHVLQEARWAPLNGALLVTEPGMDVLMKVAPLALRRKLGMAGPEDTDAEDLLLCRSFDGRKMWVLRGYDESEQCHFAITDLARVLRLSHKSLRKLRRELPLAVVMEGTSPPPGFFGGEDESPPKPAPRAAPPKVSKAPLAAAEGAEADAAEGGEEDAAEGGEEDARLQAAIREANEAARRQRLERRGKAGMASRAFLGVEPIRAETPTAPLRQAAPAAKSKSRCKPSRKVDPREAERTAAFLRECQPAIAAAKLVDEVVCEDVLPEIERKLRRSLVAARRREKRSARAEAVAAGRRRAQDLLLG